MPTAEFVSVPCAMSDALATGIMSISERELEDLRSACAWNESGAGAELQPAERIVKLSSVRRSE